MKILCEVPLEVKHYDQSQFRWLKGPDNLLFSFESKRQLRVHSIKQVHQHQLDASAHEVSATGVSETHQITSLSWNKDERLFALVVDKRDIHIWEWARNKSYLLKPHSMSASSNSMAHSPMGAAGGHGSNLLVGGQQSRKANKCIEFVAWSKLTSKLAICYASGQILLCEVIRTSSPVVTQGAEGRASSEGFGTSWERFIDNSESVLKQIVSIEVSEHAELFACFSAISEILIMTFDGHTVFYSQGERANLLNAKFSPLKREHCPRTGQYLGQTICLAYQLEHDAFLTKTVSPDGKLGEFHQSSPPVVHVLHQDQHQHHNHYQQRDSGPGQARLQESATITLIDFHWLGPTRLLLCLASGAIHTIQLDATTTGSSGTSSPTPTTGGRTTLQSVNWSGQQIQCMELLRLGAQLGSSQVTGRQLSIASSQISGSAAAAAVLPSAATCENEQPQDGGDSVVFKIFELTASPGNTRESGHGYALAIGTSYQLHYYELTQDSGGDFSLVHFDDIDLGEGLERVSLRLERARWSHDCSMLALQLTSGHLLVYRTRLRDYMVASHGARAAYLSAPNEVTILNYAGAQADEPATSQTSGSQLRATTDNALILSVNLTPSLLAIGPKHLAVALNNRVRFYPLDSLEQTNDDDDDEHTKYQEREYAAIVAGVGLCSRFAAVQFQDEGQLKLHSLRLRQANQEEVDDDNYDEERLFPDPSQPERISAFALTEQLLVYGTRNCQLAVFCLKTWRLAQVCDHSRLCVAPTWQLKPNSRGNKFICLKQPGATNNGPLLSGDIDRRQVVTAHGRSNQAVGVFLYDLYTNDVCAIGRNREGVADPPWVELVASQIRLTCASLPIGEITISRLLKATGLSHHTEASRVRIGGVTDAIWDTDGRTVVLIEPNAVHALAVLDHTLEREGPIVEYAASARKPPSYTTLYLHQGIVSYQTSLGRVTNSILETHDDELQLTRLEMRIQTIKDMRQQQPATGLEDDSTKREDCERDQARLEAQLEVMLLKVACLCSLVPIYSLAKCRDICKHLEEDEAFNLESRTMQTDEPHAYRTIDQIIWQVLAAWSLYTLNLDFASLIYRRNKLQKQAKMLTELLKDIKAGNSNMARTTVRERILALLSTQC